jgi:hypothetical protein
LRRATRTALHGANFGEWLAVDSEFARSLTAVMSDQASRNDLGLRFISPKSAPRSTVRSRFCMDGCSQVVRLIGLRSAE